MKNLKTLMQISDAVKEGVSTLLKSVEKRLTERMDAIEEAAATKSAEARESASMALLSVKEVDDKLLASIESLSAATNAISERIGEIEGKSVSLSSVEELSASVKSIREAFGANGETVKEIELRLQKCNEDFLERVKSIASEKDSLAAKVDEKIAEIASSISSVETKDFSEDIGRISNEVEEIKAMAESLKSSFPVIKGAKIEGKSLSFELGGQHDPVTFELPETQPGKDGKDGKDGAPAISVKSVKYDGEEFTFEMTDGTKQIVSYVMPKPESPMLPEAPREPVDVKEALKDSEGNLVLVLSDGSIKNIGRVDGRDGRGISQIQRVGNNLIFTVGDDDRYSVEIRDGEDGRDGFGFDDMSADLSSDGRTVNVSFTRGEEVKTFPIRFPVPLYRGVFDSERAYEEGDMVTHLGATYYANENIVGEVPGKKKGAWSVMAAAGKSVRGERGIPGKDGRNGRDLRPFSGGGMNGN